MEVSGVCLQEQRPAPEPGTEYRAAKGAALTLVLRDREGITRTLPVAHLVKIRSVRLFNSLSVSLSEQAVRERGGDFVQASLSVGPLTSVLPVAQPGDENPLTDKEIQDYTEGPLRSVAEQAIGRDRANVTATRILSQMINRLPANRSVGAERLATLRSEMMSKEREAHLPAAAGFVDRALETCREKLRVERTPHLRACIGNQHDILISNTTQTVWRKLQPGS